MGVKFQLAQTIIENVGDAILGKILKTLLCKYPYKFLLQLVSLETEIKENQNFAEFTG